MANNIKIMRVRNWLSAESRKRWEHGQGPWLKPPGELDQIDLVFLNDLAKRHNHPSESNHLSRAINTLVAEVRVARGWPRPTY